MENCSKQFPIEMACVKCFIYIEAICCIFCFLLVFHLKNSNKCLYCDSFARISDSLECSLARILHRQRRCKYPLTHFPMTTLYQIECTHISSPYHLHIFTFNNDIHLRRLLFSLPHASCRSSHTCSHPTCFVLLTIITVMLTLLFFFHMFRWIATSLEIDFCVHLTTFYSSPSYRSKHFRRVLITL